MARTAALPALKAESGLSHYLEEIRRFPMLEPQQEYMLAKSWREHNDTEAAQATARATVSAENEQLPALLAFLVAYVAFIKGTFGNAPETLADFGVPPKKAPKPPTAETKAAAAVKRMATRKARGTCGSQHKKLVKGNVTGVVVTPITAPAPQGS